MQNPSNEASTCSHLSSAKLGNLRPSTLTFLVYWWINYLCCQQKLKSNHVTSLLKTFCDPLRTQSLSKGQLGPICWALPSFFLRLHAYFTLLVQAKEDTTSGLLPGTSFPWYPKGSLLCSLQVCPSVFFSRSPLLTIPHKYSTPISHSVPTHSLSLFYFFSKAIISMWHTTYLFIVFPHWNTSSMMAEIHWTYSLF